MTDWSQLARDANETPEEAAAREARHQVLIELLGAYADRELPAETSSQIEAHLVGCTRCRRELAVHQSMRRRLGAEPPIGAPAALRERIAAAVAATPVPEPSQPAAQAGLRTRMLWWIGLATAVVLIAISTVVLLTRDDTPAVSRLEAPQRVPVLQSVLADYRRVTASELPGRARDLDAVRSAVSFPVEPLRAPGLRLVAAWTTEIAGSAAAVLAYRWEDRVVLAYLVPDDERFFGHPTMRRGLDGGRLVSARDGKQSLVAWGARESGVILVGELPPERLVQLVVATRRSTVQAALAGRVRADAE